MQGFLFFVAYCLGYIVMGVIAIILYHFVWGLRVGRVMLVWGAAWPATIILALPFAVLVLFRMYNRGVVVDIEYDYGMDSEYKPGYRYARTRESGPTAIKWYEANYSDT